MNGPGDIPLTHSSTPDTRPCSLISIIPTLGMSSCRGRAEAFARRLQSKLRTLGTQNDDEVTSPEDEPIINGGATNTWMSSPGDEQTVTDLQPLPHESDSFFDFDCELESPGSPVDECDYLRLIETASNTPHNSAAESGYVCASAASSNSSADGPYYDVISSDSITFAASQQQQQQQQQQQKQNQQQQPQPQPTPQQQQQQPIRLSASELPEYVKSLKLNGSDERLSNGLSRKGSKDDHPQSLGRAGNGEKEWPTTGPDENAMEPQGAAAIQDNIISELVKQSEHYADGRELAKENGEVAAAAVTAAGEDDREVAGEAKTQTVADAAASEPVVTISNGHGTEEGDEEILKIEVTEIDKDQRDAEASPEVELEVTQVAEVAEVTEVNKARDASPENDVDTETASTAPPAPDTSRHLSGMDTTDDEDECRPQRVRRCSSLKTGKTPPGTPGHKKIVRFADVLGLDLADVKTFLDEIPTIPKSAFEDLEIQDAEPPIQLGPKPDKLLMPLFQQPGGLATFLDIVREKQVSLENAAVTDHINQTITGTVRVRNLDFHKSVHIRYTLDGWRSYADLQANYVENSCDGFSDKFAFVLFGNSLHIGQRLELAVRFQCKGQQFWDNNYGTNYCFQCLPATTTTSNVPHAIVPSHHANNMVGLLSPTAGDAWCSSFY